DWPAGLCATAALAANTSAAARATSGSRIHMFDLPIAVDAPAGDAVVVLVREGQGRGEGLSGLTPRRNEFRTQRLDVACLIPCTALKDRRLAVPTPRHLEASERLVEHRLLQRRLTPALAAVRRHQHLGNASGARIRDAGDGVVATPFEAVAERPARNE